MAQRSQNGAAGGARAGAGAGADKGGGGGFGSSGRGRGGFRGGTGGRGRGRGRGRGAFEFGSPTSFHRYPRPEQYESDDCGPFLPELPQKQQSTSKSPAASRADARNARARPAPVPPTAPTFKGVRGQVDKIIDDYGFIDVGAKKMVYFKTAMGPRDLRAGDSVKVDYRRVAMGRYSATQVLLDKEMEQLKKACDRLYDVSDGEVCIHPSHLTLETARDLISVAEAEQQKALSRRKAAVTKQMEILKRAQNVQVRMN